MRDFGKENIAQEITFIPTDVAICFTCKILGTLLEISTLRQRLHGTGSVWNRYEIGSDKSCVDTGPGGSGWDRICYLVPNGSTYEGDPM